jgi:hypothetical protein
MVPLKNLVTKPDSPQTAGGIIDWWEGRRLHYNGIIIAWVLILALISTLLGHGGAIWKPYIIILYVLFVQLPANFWYTGGWVADLILKKILRARATWFGPWAFGVGIALSFLFILAVVFYRALLSGLSSIFSHGNAAN